MFPAVQSLDNLLTEAKRAHTDAEHRLQPHEWSAWYAAYIHNRMQLATRGEATAFADLYVSHTNEGG